MHVREQVQVPPPRTRALSAQERNRALVGARAKTPSSQGRGHQEDAVGTHTVQRPPAEGGAACHRLEEQKRRQRRFVLPAAAPDRKPAQETAKTAHVEPHFRSEVAEEVRASAAASTVHGSTQLGHAPARDADSVGAGLVQTVATGGPRPAQTHAEDVELLRSTIERLATGVVTRRAPAASHAAGGREAKVALSSSGDIPGRTGDASDENVPG